MLWEGKLKRAAGGAAFDWNKKISVFFCTHQRNVLIDSKLMCWIECARGSDLNQQASYNSRFACETFQFHDGKFHQHSASFLALVISLNGSASGRFFRRHFRPRVILLCQVGMHVCSRFTMKAINSPPLHAPSSLLGKKESGTLFSFRALILLLWRWWNCSMAQSMRIQTFSRLSFKQLQCHYYWMGLFIMFCYLSKLPGK